MHRSALDELEVAPAMQSRPAPRAPRAQRFATPLILLAITVFAGVIRFSHLERPPLLIDECFTFWRTCGSYGQLVETLRDDGFVPLHYELLWWIKQGMPLGPHVHIVRDGLFQTPFIMRFIPALCGTLMVPVMYFVARQLFGRATSLLAAFFTACSAYAMFFSRDGKMYAPAWMLAALAVGSLLWWLRTRRSTAWLAWVAAGSAAAGVHVVTMLLLVLAPLFLLTQRRMHWRQGLLMLAGAMLIAAGPAGYYLTFNRWAERSGGLVPGVTAEPAPDANWGASGLGWIGDREIGANEAFRSLSAYLTAYEWDGHHSFLNWGYRPNWVSRTGIACVSVICGLLVLGALPWPRRWRLYRGVNFDAPEPSWRAALWLACWIVLPAYGFFYCRSYDDAASPGDWLAMAGAWWGERWWWIVLATVALAGVATRWCRAGDVLGGIVVLAVVTIIVLFAIDKADDVRMVDWLGASLRDAALIFVPAALWMFSGNSNRERLAAALRFAIVLGVVLSLCAGAHATWDSLRAASMARHPEIVWHSIWHTRYIGVVLPAVWIAAAALVMRLPTRPLRIAAVILIIAPNLANGIARFNAQTQVPYDRVFIDVWLAKPGSNVRTYFDLEGQVFGASGFPKQAYWRPEAAYNAALAGRLATTPPEFRAGKDWPFVYGPFVERFAKWVEYRPYTSAASIHSDLNPTVDRVIVWNIDRMFQTTAADYQRQLGPTWRTTSDESIGVWWFWNWTQQLSFHRCEFTRVAPAATTQP